MDRQRCAVAGGSFLICTPGCWNRRHTAPTALLAVMLMAAVACGGENAVESQADIPGAAETPSVLAPADGDGAFTAFEAFMEAVTTLDLDSARTFYGGSIHFRWVEDGARRCRSSRELRKVLAAELAKTTTPPTVTLPDLTVESLGGEGAVATCHFVSKADVDGGAEFHLSGAMTVVMSKVGERWQFVSGHIAPGHPWPVCLGSCTAA